MPRRTIVYPDLVNPKSNVTAVGQGQLRVQEDSDNGRNSVGFKAPTSITSDITWTLPNSDGTSGEVLTTDGSSNLSWGVGGGGSTPIGNLNYHWMNYLATTNETFGGCSVQQGFPARATIPEDCVIRKVSWYGDVDTITDWGVGTMTVRLYKQTGAGAGTISNIFTETFLKGAVTTYAGNGGFPALDNEIAMIFTPNISINTDDQLACSVQYSDVPGANGEMSVGVWLYTS